MVVESKPADENIVRPLIDLHSLCYIFPSRKIKIYQVYVIQREKKIFYPLEPFYNHFHNILRLFDVLTNFSFTTSETMRDYYL